MAMYGRQNKKTCRTWNPFPDTNCKSKQSVYAVRNECEEKQTCRFTADNEMFGDPCRYTYKYLTVEYHCISKLGRSI